MWWILAAFAVGIVVGVVSIVLIIGTAVSRR